MKQISEIEINDSYHLMWYDYKLGEVCSTPLTVVNVIRCSNGNPIKAVFKVNCRMQFTRAIYVDEIEKIGGFGTATSFTRLHAVMREYDEDTFRSLVTKFLEKEVDKTRADKKKFINSFDMQVQKYDRIISEKQELIDKICPKKNTD